MSNPADAEPPGARPPLSARGVLLAVVVSVTLALVALLVFVLPAEHNMDPLGAGELLGIRGMSGYSVSAFAIEEEDYRQDQIEFPLEPFESIEYKYVLQQGQAMVFSWQSNGEVVFDLHSEAEGSDPEQAVSFSVGRSHGESGTYTAPYDGVHGWFWENRGAEAVVVSLRTSGFYHSGIVYGPAGSYPRALE